MDDDLRLVRPGGGPSRRDAGHAVGDVAVHDAGQALDEAVDDRPRRPVVRAAEGDGRRLLVEGLVGQRQARHRVDGAVESGC